MTRRILLVLSVLGCFFATAAGVVGQDAPEAARAADAGEGEIAEWIKQLDADRFTDREAASAKLAEAGDRALPALIEAAQSGAPETAARSVNILGDHLAKGDPQIKAAAKAALETIAQSENSVAARRAKAALEESEKPQVTQPNPRVLPLRIFGGNIQGGIQIGGGGQIQIQVAQNNGVQVRRVAIANNNGVKQINAEEGGRKVKIKDDPKNGIEMEVTETKDGKEVTQKYQAKDADDLKKKHPDAHKIYQQYSNQAPAAPRPAANAIQRSAEIRIDALQRSVESVERFLDQVENNLGKDKTKELKRRLENVKNELSEAKKKLSDEQPAGPAENSPQQPPENKPQGE